jgi:acyl carrier protein
MTTTNGFGVVTDYLRQCKPELEDLPEDLDLIENRILDSLAFVEFLLLLEEHTGQEISIDSVSREDFRTLASIKRRFFDVRP